MKNIKIYTHINVIIAIAGNPLKRLEGKGRIIFFNT